MSYLPLILTILVIAGLVYFVEKYIARQRREKRVQEFRTWVDTRVQEPTVRAWLINQNVDESAERLKELRKFCKQENLDVNLVLQGKLDNRAGLQQQADHMSAMFLGAMQERTLLHEDLEAFAYYSAYARRPKRRRYNGFVPDLYLSLIEEGVINAPPLNESMRQSDRKRRKQAREAIMAAAESEPEKFNRALKRTLFSADAPPLFQTTTATATA